MWECIKIVPATKRIEQSDFVSFNKNFNYCYLVNLAVKIKVFRSYRVKNILVTLFYIKKMGSHD